MVQPEYDGGTAVYGPTRDALDSAYHRRQVTYLGTTILGAIAAYHSVRAFATSPEPSALAALVHLSLRTTVNGLGGILAFAIGNDGFWRDRHDDADHALLVNGITRIIAEPKDARRD